MKNILKIKIHPIFYIFLIICFFTGYFRYFIYVSSLIFIHEIGHATAALYYNFNISKIVILPFGGITIFNDLINRPLFQEFIVLIMGPIYQIIFYLLLVKLGYHTELLENTNTFLLLFNSLPIVPLDGSKLINIILNIILSFKKSNIILISISLLFIVILLLFNHNNLILILIFLFLISRVIKEIKEHKYLFNKFLFERYIYNLKFKKIKQIKNIKDMKRDYNHYSKIDGIYYSEKDILSRYYKKNNWLDS